MALPTLIVLEAVDRPTVIVPVCAVPPTVIVPVVTLPPMLYTEAAAPSAVTFPLNVVALVTLNVPSVVMLVPTVVAAKTEGTTSVNIKPAIDTIEIIFRMNLVCIELGLKNKEWSHPRASGDL